MDSIKEYEYIDPVLFADIKGYISTLDLKFEDSLLFDGNTKQKLLDKTKRQSKFCNIVDQTLFSKFEKIVETLNTDQTSKYSLVKNDITYLKYKQGDFFQAHSDYLSYTSNMIKEYTLILCLAADCVGGETIFHINPKFKHVSKHTTTPGCMVLFRKDYMHEGNKLQYGYKDVLVANILETSKKNNGYLVVKCKKGNPIIIPSEHINNLNSKLKTFYAEQNQVVSVYNTEYTYNQMKIISDILHRKHISFNKFKNNYEFIKEFGISIEEIIVDGDVAKKKNKSGVCKHFTGNDIMIFNNTAITHYYLENIVKPQKLNYVPFHMVLVEGDYAALGDMSSGIQHVNITPITTIVGEAGYIVKCTQYHNDTSDGFVEDDSDDDSDDQVSFVMGHCMSVYNWNMNIMCGHYSLDNMNTLIKQTRPEFETNNENVKKLYVFKKFNDIYSIDAKTGVQGFTKTQLKIMKEKWPSIEEKIIKMLPTVSLDLPQIDSFSREKYLCNENYYGNFTMVHVSGLFKM